MEIIRTEHKIAVEVDGKELAYVLFPSLDKNTIVIQTTYVDPSLRGQGIAKLLMDETYEMLKTSNKKATLACSYAIKYFADNKEKQDIL